MLINRNFHSLAVVLVIAIYSAMQADAAIYTTDLTIPPDITTSDQVGADMRSGATLTVTAGGKLQKDNRP